MKRFALLLVGFLALATMAPADDFGFSIAFGSNQPRYDHGRHHHWKKHHWKHNYYVRPGYYDHGTYRPGYYYYDDCRPRKVVVYRGCN